MSGRDRRPNEGGIMDGAGGDRCCSLIDIVAVAVAPPSAYIERISNLSTLPAMSKLQGWAEFPDALLHSIVDMLGSFTDFLAFASTCHPWRVSFSSYPSKYTLSTRFPPLQIQPDTSLCSPRPHPFSNSLILEPYLFLPFPEFISTYCRVLKE